MTPGALVPPVYGDQRIRQSFWQLVAPDETSGCWVWAGRLNGKGYCNSYRRVFERLVGPVPVGLTIDHVCRNRACVNPAHMEPVTQEENNRRSLRARAAAGQEMPWSGKREQTAEYKARLAAFNAKKYRDRRGAAHTPTPHKEHQCGLCGGTGHNRRRCHIEREAGAPARAAWRQP